MLPVMLLASARHDPKIRAEGIKEAEKAVTREDLFSLFRPDVALGQVVGIMNIPIKP